MRPRILWATLALLVCSALGLSTLAGAADHAVPSTPDSTWSVIASMPQGVYGAAGASNGTFAYAAGGYATATGTTLSTF